MLAVQDSPAGRFLDGLGPALPRPAAIVLASAHFIAAAGDRAPASGAPGLAASISERLAAAGLGPHERPSHGIEHGVWVPLRRMQADIPVVPLSVNPQADATHHYNVGRALAALREDGVLVIGSGGFVHNLGDLDWQHPDAAMPAWASGFAEWMRARLAAADLPALLDWQQQAPRASHG